MNWLDVAVAVGLAAFALRGFLKGLVAESLGFLGLLVAAAASLYANPAAADLLRRVLSSSRPFAAVMAAVLVFLLAEFAWLLGLYFLVGRKRKPSFRRSGADRVGGALFWVGKGVMWASLMLLVFQAILMPGAHRSAAEGAEFAGMVRGVAPWVGARVATVLPRSARQRYEAFRNEVARLGARWWVMAPKAVAPQPSAAPAPSSSPASGGPQGPPRAGGAGAASQPPAQARP